VRTKKGDSLKVQNKPPVFLMLACSVWEYIAQAEAPPFTLKKFGNYRFELPGKKGLNGRAMVFYGKIQNINYMRK